MIKYEWLGWSYKKPLPVLLDDKLVGEIRPVNGGWQYFPKGSKIGGDVFKRLPDCQRSLEEGITNY